MEKKKQANRNTENTGKENKAVPNTSSTDIGEMVDHLVANAQQALKEYMKLD